MAFVFKPAIYKSASLYELPRPVPAVRVHDAWDYAQLKVPLAHGDTLLGHSRQGVDVFVEGRFGSQAGGLVISEEAMFTEWLSLRDVLNVTGRAEKYEFFLYHDAATGTYRKFKSCSTVRLECDLSSKHLFEYSLVIHAEDPTMHSTGPGE